jgi:hypothetical protein
MTRKTQDTKRKIQDTRHKSLESRVLSLESYKTPYAHKLNRRKYKRRFSNLRMLAVAILLALITSASILAFERLRDGFLDSSIFTLDGVSIQGNRRISSADILDASNLRVGIDSIYSIIPHIVEKRIRARFRYLERVEVQRRLAHEQDEKMHGWVTITVKEREPVALVGSGRDADSFAVIDIHGFILEEDSGHETSDMRQETEGLESEVSSLKSQVSRHGDMPVIVGSVRHASWITGLALDVLTVARSVIPELFDEISYIDARDPDNIILILDTGLGSSDQSLGNKGFFPDPSLESSIQYPVSSKMTIQIASRRIEEGLGDILPVIMEFREKNGIGSDAKEERNRDGRTEGSPLSRNSHVSFDARFPGAVYCKVNDL